MEATAITATDMARSLWIIYQHMPAAVQNEFKRLIDDEEPGEGYANTQWLALSEPSLHELWDAPEEDYWDELYAKLHPTD